MFPDATMENRIESLPLVRAGVSCSVVARSEDEIRNEMEGGGGGEQSPILLPKSTRSPIRPTKAPDQQFVSRDSSICQCKILMAKAANPVCE
jgi:hypothetical protein